MIYAILNRLNSDLKLNALLESNEKNSKICPLFAAKDDTNIVYQDAIVMGGDVRENRLELRIIVNNYDKMMLIENRLCELLDIKEYEQTFKFGDVSILKSSLVGGGTLENDSTHTLERIMLFQIKWKTNNK